MRERARVQDAWLAERLDTVVPRLMREQGFDMWVLIAREYLEDPVMSTMLNATSMRARRRTILVFFDPGGGRPVERLTVSRYGLGGLFQPSWNPDTQPDQFARLAAIVAERNPRRIAINVSPDTAFADGLTHSQYQGFIAALPARFARAGAPDGRTRGRLAGDAHPGRDGALSGDRAHRAQHHRRGLFRPDDPSRHDHRGTTSSGGIASGSRRSASPPGSTPRSRSSAAARRSRWTATR